MTSDSGDSNVAENADMDGADYAEGVERNSPLDGEQFEKFKKTLIVSGALFGIGTVILVSSIFTAGIPQTLAFAAIGASVFIGVLGMSRFAVGKFNEMSNNE